jgi:hypothetical protein
MEERGGACDGWQGECKENGELELQARGGKSTHESREDLHRAKGHLQQNRVELVESKRLDNEGPDCAAI